MLLTAGLLARVDFGYQLVANGPELAVLLGLALHRLLQRAYPQLGLEQLGFEGRELDVRRGLGTLDVLVGLGELELGVLPEGLVPTISVGELGLQAGNVGL